MVRGWLAAIVGTAVHGKVCPESPHLDLCDDTSGAFQGIGTPILAIGLALTNTLGGHTSSAVLAPLVLSSLVMPGLAAESSSSSKSSASKAAGMSMTCGAVKTAYGGAGCCGEADKSFDIPIPATHMLIETATHMAVPKLKTGTTRKIGHDNKCAEKKPEIPNTACYKDGVAAVLEQSGRDVTDDNGGINAVSGWKPADATPTGTKNLKMEPRMPILQDYHKTALCPVNVHWHSGAEHRSGGQYQEGYVGPNATRRLEESASVDHGSHAGRGLGAKARVGFQCKFYQDAKKAGTDEYKKYTTEYNWQHCVGMKVGHTYEVHWPSSALGACGTPYQYQTPFYDGVFCGYDGVSELPLQTVASAVGVQAQVFTIINDESYYYPDLIRGMIVDEKSDFGKDMAAYTGSTTGTSRDNKICSNYNTVTWQVDRTCHLISASSFDKMCADMKQQVDDMSDDLHAHGARELVQDALAANNLHHADSHAADYKMKNPPPTTTTTTTTKAAVSR